MSRVDVQSFESTITINHQFNIFGAELPTYNELVRVTLQTMARRIRCLNIPAQPLVSLLDLTDGLDINLPIKAEENEDKAFSHAEVHNAFGYVPIAFEEGIRKEVALFRVGRDGLSA